MAAEDALAMEGPGLPATDGARDAPRRKPGALAQRGQELTGQALASSWRFLIPSFFLTLVYINLHYLAKYFLGIAAFSEFGQALPFGKPGSVLQRKVADMFAGEWFEIILMLVCDAIFGSIILIGIVVVVAVVWAHANPGEAALIFTREFVNYITGG